VLDWELPSVGGQGYHFVELSFRHGQGFLQVRPIFVEYDRPHIVNSFKDATVLFAYHERWLLVVRLEPVMGYSESIQAIALFAEAHEAHHFVHNPTTIEEQEEVFRMEQSWPVKQTKQVICRLSNL
jgi:hypothetical protein